MAMIPRTIGGLQPRETPHVGVVAPAVSDDGLGRAAESLAGVAASVQRTQDLQLQVQGQAADEEASRAFAQARTATDTGFVNAAKTYDGLTPGFAGDQIAARDKTFADARAGLSDWGQARFDRKALEHRVSFAEQATSVEAAAQGRQLAAQREAEQGVRVSAAVGDSLVKTQARMHDAFNAPGDPTSPDFSSRQLAAFDASRDATVAAARPEDRPRLQLELQGQRVNLQLSLAHADRDLADARIATTASQGLETLINGVTADPTLLPKALAQGQAIATNLPADKRQALQAELPGRFAAAALNGMVTREDWHGLQGALDNPAFKSVLSPGDYSTFRARATQALTSEARGLAQVRVQDALNAEVASLRETGVSTGFDPSTLVSALGPVEGPAAVLRARQTIADAGSIHRLLGDAAALPSRDLEARLALLKPAGGDADFAHKQAVFEQGVAFAQAQVAKRAADPASAIQADKVVASLWRSAASGSATDAQLWAKAALQHQDALGIVPDAQRVLPVDEAKRLATTVDHAQGLERVKALQSAAAYVSRFGPYSGRVVDELAKAGMERTDAALLVEVGGDPVALGQYARGRERGAAVKISEPDQKALNTAVVAALKPLAASFAPMPGGAEHADALRDAIATSAKGFMADGARPAEAASKAAATLLSRFTITKAGWRMPASLAAGQAQVEEAPNVYAAVRSGADLPVHRTVSLSDAVSLGAGRVQGDLVEGGGAALLPRGAEPSLTPAQKQARYADIVADRSRWANLPGDDGLMLVLPSPAGGFTPVLDKGGKAITRSWAELQARAAKIAR